MLITSENLNFGYAGEPLLENLTFSLNENDRVGVVGGNGEGKTTLTEAILFNAGVIDRQGRVDDGNTAAYFSKKTD